MTRLARFELLRGLDADTLREIETRCRFVTYEPHGLILDLDDQTNDVYFVLSGEVRIIYRSPVGREVILGEIGAGGLFGEIAAIDREPRSANVTALSRSEICIMPSALFLELIDRVPQLKSHLLRLLASRIRTLNARLAEHSFLQARFRLYAELLRLARPRAGAAGESVISPPPFQHDLANRIGARREVVSRELSALEKEGLVEKTRGGLVLKDPQELNRRIYAALDA